MWQKSGTEETHCEWWEKNILIFVGQDIAWDYFRTYNKHCKSNPDYIPMWKQDSLSKICRDIFNRKIGARAGERRIRKII